MQRFIIFLTSRENKKVGKKRRNVIRIKTRKNVFTSIIWLPKTPSQHSGPRDRRCGTNSPRVVALIQQAMNVTHRKLQISTTKS